MTQIGPTGREDTWTSSLYIILIINMTLIIDLEICFKVTADLFIHVISDIGLVVFKKLKYVKLLTHDDEQKQDSNSSHEFL